MVEFFGNYQPTIDSVQIGFWDPDYLDGSPEERVFRQIQTDTLFFGWIGGDPSGSGYEKWVDRGDTLYIDDWSINASENTLTKYYRFVIRAFGHDDPRDPGGPETGVLQWGYSIDDLEGYDYPYTDEDVIMFDFPPNYFEYDVVVSITVPLEEDVIKGDSLVVDPPVFFGDQEISIVGGDIDAADIYLQGIRGISPVYDGCTLITPGDWIIQQYRLASVARRDTVVTPCFFKMVW